MSRSLGLALQALEHSSRLLQSAVLAPGLLQTLFIANATAKCSKLSQEITILTAQANFSGNMPCVLSDDSMPVSKSLPALAADL